MVSIGVGYKFFFKKHHSIVYANLFLEKSALTTFKFSYSFNEKLEANLGLLKKIVCSKPNWSSESANSTTSV